MPLVVMDVPKSSASPEWLEMNKKISQQCKFFDNLSNRERLVIHHNPPPENLSGGSNSVEITLIFGETTRRPMIVRSADAVIVQNIFNRSAEGVSDDNWQKLRLVSMNTRSEFNQRALDNHNPSPSIVGTASRTFSPIRSSSLSSQAGHRSFLAPPFEEGEADSAAPRLQEVNRGAALQSRAEETELSSQRPGLPSDLDAAVVDAIVLGLTFACGYQPR